MPAAVVGLRWAQAPVGMHADAAPGREMNHSPWCKKPCWHRPLGPVREPRHCFAVCS